MDIKCYHVLLAKKHRIAIGNALKKGVLSSNMLWQPELIKFEEQPDIPEADLTPGNAEMFGSYWLVKNPEVKLHATWLAKHQQSIYKVAYAAMKFNELDVSANPPDYMAFCIGFASLEWMSAMVRQGETQESKTTIIRPREYPMGAASAQVTRLFMDPGAFANYELSKRTKEWAEKWPKTAEAITEAGSARARL